MTCQEFRENADVFALGALSPGETAEAEVHLATCNGCAADYLSAAAVAEQLPLSVPVVRAPAGLRSRVFAAIRADTDEGVTLPRVAAGEDVQPPLRSVQSAIAMQPIAADSVPSRLAGQPSGVARSRVSDLSARLHLSALAAAFAGLAIIGLTSWNAWLQIQVHDLKRPHAAAAAASPLASQPSFVASPRGSSSAEAAALILLSSPGTVRAQLDNPASRGPSGAIFWNPKQRRCVVLARQLEPVTQGEEYHVWFREGEKRWDGGPLVPDAQGTAEAVVPMDRWQIGDGYTIAVVVQRNPDDGTRRSVLTGQIQLQTQ